MHLLAFAETIQLFPDGTLFIHVALILLMIWVLNRTLYRPINRILETRDKSKGGHSSEAESVSRRVEEKEARYNQDLLQARTEGYALIESEQKAATAKREERLAEARTLTAASVADEKNRLETEVSEARRSLADGAEKLAAEITENILKTG